MPTPPNEFVAYLMEVFEGFGPVDARRMFSGHGLFHDGLMFAVVIDDVLYLKADAGNAPDFEARGLERFGYSRNGRRVELSYYRAPDELLEDRELAAAWARRAFAAALRGQAPRARKKPRRPQEN